MEGLSHLEQLRIDGFYGRKPLKETLWQDSKVLALGLETIFVSLRMFRDLSTTNAWHGLASFSSKVQERTQLHSLGIEVDPNDTTTRLMLESRMYLL